MGNSAAPFGTMNKSAKQTFACFLVSCAQLITQLQTADGSAEARSSKSRLAKFQKYCSRLQAILNESHAKIQPTQTVYQQMSESFVQHAKETQIIVQHSVQCLAFEDRKQVQQIVLTVSQQSQSTKENFTRALLPQADAIVSDLLTLYGSHEQAPLVGTYLRVFTASSQLMEASWLKLEHIARLKKLVLDPDFNVQSDALETMRELFLSTQRTEGDGILHKFLSENAQGILEIFNDIGHQDADANYFAIRESMKLEYEILTQHVELMRAFGENEKYLVQTMQNLTDDANSITYEALLLLSFFVMRPVKNDQVKTVLHKNAKQMIEFIQRFKLKSRPAEEIEEFRDFRDQMLMALRQHQTGL